MSQIKSNQIKYSRLERNPARIILVNVRKYTSYSKRRVSNLKKMILVAI